MKLCPYSFENTTDGLGASRVFIVHQQIEQYSQYPLLNVLISQSQKEGLRDLSTEKTKLITLGTTNKVCKH